MYYLANSISLSEYWRQYDLAAERVKLYNQYQTNDEKKAIRPYRTLEEALENFKNVYRKTIEAKFTAPNNLNEWE